MTGTTTGVSWTQWTLEPVALLAIMVVGGLYLRGGAQGSAAPDQRRRGVALGAALVLLGIAVMSPLDVAAGRLASAHMVQHLLLGLVVAPLLVLAAPGPRVLRAVPRDVVARGMRIGRVLRIVPGPAWWRRMDVAWLANIAVLWGWHAAVPYDAALRNELVHVLQHGSWLLAGWLWWRVVLRHRTAQPGIRLLFVFTTAMATVFLAALMTFAGTAWYDGYRGIADTAGLTPLADQQLAGALMWVPGGLVYPATALWLLVGWLRAIDLESQQPRAAA